MPNKNTENINNSKTVGITKKLLPKKLDGKAYYSSPGITPQWIIIHNVGPGSAKACYNTFLNNARNVSTHFTCDDKEIIQMLELNWKGIHTQGKGYNKNWTTKNCGANNNNSIGIEVGNSGGSIQLDDNKSIEMAIELTRYLMKELNIDIDHVVRHGDTQNKNCPEMIMRLNKWDYFKSECVKRNKENKEYIFDPNKITAPDSSSNNSGYTGGNNSSNNNTPLYATPTDIDVELPDVDHRENITNMCEVKGLSFTYYPPYTSCEISNKDNHFTSLNWDRTYHYTISKKTDEISLDSWIDEKTQSKGFTDNDTHTYIDRALFSNKREKHCLTVALLCPEDTTDYPSYEKALIEYLAQLLHEHALEVKDLWREFDLNKAASPILYLDRNNWKDLLTEIEKIYNWRVEKYGKYTKTYTPYTAGSSGLSGGSTQSIASILEERNNNIDNKETRDTITDAPIGDNSAGGINHDDWGGVMTYTKGTPTNENAKKPEIETIITQEMFEELIQYSDFKLVDDYVNDFEPYNKGLASVENNTITVNDRVNTMTKTFSTTNENTFHYKVIEAGPGSKDHCVTTAEELDYIAVPQDIKVEPIYPDLVIPPGYVTTEADKTSPNSIPIATVVEGAMTSADAYTKQMSFDYDLLEGKKKESKKTHHPNNYMDPYPYDEKITDLEKHFPKVHIDEIESQLYSCNHPGCPIAQPMAKNFAMVSDALMNQSKRAEKRLAKLENILSTVIRNQGRLGSRMNINCVYYGGHSTFNKYKCIRCLHDDRVHDGALVTIDQCLNCTRFEPILGQVYRILDDSGLNGSIILDDMQMSYTDLEGFRNLNDITHRSSRYYNSMATDEKNCTKPEKPLEDIWKEADKQQAIDIIKKETTDSKEAQTKIDNLKEEDYIFRMDWDETYLRTQEPDTKLYPNEGLIARQKVKQGDGSSLEDAIKELDPVKDADAIKDLKEQIKIRDSIWVDTREVADSVQVNKYSSENFLFEGFNKARKGQYGVSFSGINASEEYNNYNSSGSSGFATDARNKIVEMAKQIYQQYVDGKAKYCQIPRTVDFTKPKTNGGKICYDCTSTVSCCYLHAGLNSVYDKSCSGGTLVKEILKGGKIWACNEEGLKEAKPGDIVLTATSTISGTNITNFFSTTHAMVYIGDGNIIHAAGTKSGIKYESLGYRLTNGKHVFARPADLIEADKKAESSNNNSGVTETAGNVDGKDYVMRIPGAVVTAYTGSGKGASGLGCVYNSTCASHNMPYGTKIYIPALAGKAGNGIFTVTDTGGCFFDFDIFTNTWAGKTNMDAYVLEWGTGKVAASYKWAINYYLGKNSWTKYIPAWNTYKNMGGKLINFHKYKSEDADIKSHPNYND